MKNSLNFFRDGRFLIRNSFINKKTGQISLTIPKKNILGFFDLKKIPDKFIVIPVNKLNLKGGKI